MQGLNDILAERLIQLWFEGFEVLKPLQNGSLSGTGEGHSLGAPVVWVGGSRDDAPGFEVINELPYCLLRDPKADCEIRDAGSSVQINVREEREVSWAQRSDFGRWQRGDRHVVEQSGTLEKKVRCARLFGGIKLPFEGDHAFSQAHLT
jgi:hypothetical protein